MKELEVELGERTYRIRTEVGNAFSHLNGPIGDFELLRDMIDIYNDLNSGDKVLIRWNLIPPSASGTCRADVADRCRGMGWLAPTLQ
ncbi:hypothetical protein EV648_1284 [Kribbella sp. VKM Ac-2568]|nr:hypothetical protein EV648_1284 [Kribbella sp. VKM Ac-2568]